MPLLFGAFMSLGAGGWWSWRLAMLVAGAALLITGIAYYFLTQDTPDGDFRSRSGPSRAPGAFAEACRDPRVWALALLYASSFGVELTIDNFAALYYTDTFHLTLKAAGVVAGTFGMMNLFARALGGIVSDKCNRRWGLRGRVLLLACTITAEGLAMMLFAQARWLPAAIGTMLLMGLFVKMSNGANYAVVPFINKRALGAVAGIVGAGGNLGAVLAGFLFKTPSLTYSQALMVLGTIVAASSVVTFAVRFTAKDAPPLGREMAAATAIAAGD
jgi:NNP family nitrate/nitrite transporter-like MFS transporter